jgi:hypothetical protein
LYRYVPVALLLLLALSLAAQYPACDDEIWRAGVDLESLKNMMKAVKKP